MKWWIVAACLAVLGLISASVLSLKGQLDGTRGQLEQARTQFATQERSDRQALTAASDQISAAKAVLSATQAKLNASSTTGDLISCGDLQLFETGWNLQWSAGGSTGPVYSQGTWLPQHCYKP